MNPFTTHSEDPWFRVGSVDVTTSIFAAGIGVLSMFLWAISQELFAVPLVLDHPDVASGQIWRVVTYPLVNEPSIFPAISIAMLLLVGSQIERVLGRLRYLYLLLAVIIVPGIIGGLLLPGFPAPAVVYGVDYLVGGLFVVFVLINPTARSFFNIPLWVIVAVFEGILLLQLLANRSWALLVFDLASLGTAAIMARSFGLTEYTQIPKIPLPAFITGDRYQKANRQRERTQKQARKHRGPAAVVPIRGGVDADDILRQADLDMLLDKISATGLDSLTEDERKRLERHSKRGR